MAERSLHVTLAFIGRRPEDEIEAIAAATDNALAGCPPPRLRAKGVRALPPRRPRLFALDLEDRDDRAAAAQAAISQALERGGWYEPERRAFWPHITFARIVKGARHVKPLAKQPPPPQDPFTAATVTLYRSHLSPRGARYEALARTRLSARGR